MRLGSDPLVSFYCAHSDILAAVGERHTEMKGDGKKRSGREKKRRWEREG